MSTSLVSGWSRVLWMLFSPCVKHTWGVAHSLPVQWKALNNTCTSWEPHICQGEGWTKEGWWLKILIKCLVEISESMRSWSGAGPLLKNIAFSEKTGLSQRHWGLRMRTVEDMCYKEMKHSSCQREAPLWKPLLPSSQAHWLQFSQLNGCHSKLWRFLFQLSCVCVHSCAYICMCMHVCIWVCIFVCVYVYSCMWCDCVCVWLCGFQCSVDCTYLLFKLQMESFVDTAPSSSCLKSFWSLDFISRAPNIICGYGISL